MVGGGDGSISCAPGAVAGTGVTLGVLPLGTANDFARTLQVRRRSRAPSPPSPRGASSTWTWAGVGATAYLNVASIGLSVGVTEKLSRA